MVQVDKQQLNTKWSTMVKRTFSINFVWDCNLSPKDFKQLFGTKEVCMFVLLAWSKVHFVYPTKTETILDQVLWFNSLIRDIKGKMLYYKKWYAKGIKNLRQIVDLKNKGYATLQNLCEHYGQVINVIDFARLHKCIPKDWLLVLRRNIDVGPKTISEIIKNNVRCAGLVYDFVIAKRPVLTKMRYKWEQELTCEILNANWEMIYIDVCKLTFCTKLRYFHYQIIHGYLITNIIVSKWDRNQTENCELCKQEPEKVHHLFCNCIESRKLWCAIKAWIDYFCYIPVRLYPL